MIGGESMVGWVFDMRTAQRTGWILLCDCCVFD